jgi:ankyrin repeat protein
LAESRVANPNDLHHAIINANDRVALSLVEHGANVNTRDENMATPLHYARKPYLVSWLVASGADVNAKDSHGRTPLLYALDSRAGNDVIEDLLCNGADIGAKDSTGRTAWDIALALGNTDAIEILDNHLMDSLLIRAGTQTLHGAVLEGDPVMVALLITKGADVNARNDDGMTPLDLAIAQGKSDVAEILKANGAQITTPSDRLEKRLLDAIINGDKTTVKKLIDESANLNLGLDVALTCKDREVVKLLVARGAIPTGTDLYPVHSAVFRNDKIALEKSIADGADINAMDLTMTTPLDWALMLGRQEIAKFLIIKGAAKAEWLKASKESDDSNETADRYISKEVRREVWRRDQGKCVQCGSQEKLELDHIIPVSKGGSNTARNIQLLCERCNREKAADI